jgi:hypothetical protein
MAENITFFGSIRNRVSEMVKEYNSFNGDILTWDDFKKGKISNNYCVYQTETLHLSHKLTNEYKKFLDDAKYVFDYSLSNLNYYPKAIHLPLKIKQLPEINNTNKKDIVFFGHLTSRRKDLLDKITKSGVPINTVNGVYGDKLKNLLSNNKYVLSLGSYDNNCNDSFRVIPAIENGCIVLMEETKETWFNEYLLKECSDRVLILKSENLVNEIKNIKL